MDELYEDIAHDDFGATEGDEKLRSEIINAKLDLLIGLVGEVASLQVGLKGRKPLEAMEKYNQSVSTLGIKLCNSIKHSIKQYKDRKKK